MRFIVERIVDKKQELVSVIAASIDDAREAYKNCRIFKLKDDLSFEQAKMEFIKSKTKSAKK